MSDYVLSQRAKEQLRDIQLYTIENFGERQAIRYLDSLRECFQLIASQRRMGRLAPSIGPGLRRHEHQSHVVLYEIVADEVVILAVVHHRNLSEFEL